MATATINGMTAFGGSASGADAGWGNIGAGPGGGQNTDDFIEGTDSFGGRKTASGRGLSYTLSAGSVNMSSTTTHIYCWINCKSVSALDTIANGGMILRVGSSSANYRSFYIGGSNTVRAGWQMYVIDPTKTGSISDTGTPNMAAVTYIGVELTISGTVGGTSDNILMDVIRYTTGPYITGGTSGDRLLWSNIATADAASAFGLIQQRSGVYFIAGKLALGAPSGSSGDCYLDDGGQIIVWEPKEYHNGTSVVTALATNYNGFVIQEGTGTTDVEDGTLVGSGDDRTGTGGSVFKRSPTGISGAANTNDCTLRTDAVAGSATAIDFHGSTFDGFTGACTLSDDATDGPNHVYAGVTFVGCSTISGGRVVLRNCTFAGSIQAVGLSWLSSTNVRNSQFLNNTGGSTTAAIQHKVDGDYSYVGLIFTGNDFDVSSNRNATNIQSYPNTNQDSEVNIGNGTLDGVAQSFQNGTAGQLTKCTFYLRKVGSPTGNLTAKLYAHSGTFGTSSVPTGATLVAATAFDVSTLTGSLADVDIYFEAAEFYDLTGGPTNYCIAIEYTGGDVSNYVAVGYDGSAPSSAGNAATLASGGGWTAQSYDLIHDVFRDGEVQVNASSGSNPTTKQRAGGTEPSAIAIINTVSLKVTVLDEAGSAVQNAQTGIFALETAGGVTKGDELISGAGGADTNASGIVENANYNYAGAVNVEVRSRKSSTADSPRYKHLKSPQVIGASGLNVTVTLIADPQNN